MQKIDNKGFSLVELLIAVGISVITILAIYDVFIVSKKNYALQEEITDMQQNARACIEFISREMRNISSIVYIDCTNKDYMTFYTIEETGTATGGTPTTLIDTSQSWDPNEWAGDILAIIDGEGSGQARSLISNSSNRLSIYGLWATDPNTDSFYQIRRFKGFSRDTSNDELDYISSSGTSSFSLNITGITFQGYDINGSATCTAGDIEKLEITVTARTSKPDPDLNNQYHYYTLKTSINLRN